MNRKNNIYTFRNPKALNEEVAFMNPKGRITRSAFFLRLLFGGTLFVVFKSLHTFDFFLEHENRVYIFLETTYFYILPSFLAIFFLIQGAKRIHDVNRSGWYIFCPFYNVYLVFSRGTRGNNDYGIDPAPRIRVEYFDELDQEEAEVNISLSDPEKMSGLDKWNEHVKKIRKDNPQKTYQEALEIARETFRTGGAQNQTSTGAPTLNPIKVIFLISLLVFFAIYYVKIYEPNHRDTDNDGIADVLDECPVDFGVSFGSARGCPDADNDGIPNMKDSCPDEPGNETDGCFYFKTVEFDNNSKNQVLISVAYKDSGEWICQGWYRIATSESFVFYLPKYFKGEEVFWYAENEFGDEWSGRSKYFYVENGGDAGFEVRNGKFKERGGGRAVKRGFLKLELTDENTNQGLID